MASLENSPVLLALSCLGKALRDKNKSYTDKVSVLVSVSQSAAECILSQSLIANDVEQIIEIIYYSVAEVVLHCRWLTIDRVTRNHVKFTLKKFLKYLKAIKLFNYSRLVASLIKLVEDPWGHPTINKIMTDEKLSDDEVCKFFEKETLVLIGIRVNSLIDSDCEDLALKLIWFVVKYCHVSINSVIKVFIRVITQVINQIEEAESKNRESKIRKVEKKLSCIFLVLFEVFHDCKAISRECILSAYSLEPNNKIFSLIEMCNARDFPKLQPGDRCVSSKRKRNVRSLGALSAETGKCLTESPDYDPSIAACDIIDDCERLNLPKEHAHDLISIISYPRYKRLSWMYDWTTLRKNCKDYMKNGVNMKKPSVELKHINIDFNEFL